MMHLTQALHKALLERPDATVLVCGERRTTFTQFVDRVARLAAVLKNLGLQVGDRVAMMALNSDRYVEYLYATWWAGGVINPVNIRWTGREVAYSLDDCDTRILLVDEHFLTLAAELPALSRSLQATVFFGNGSAPFGFLDGEGLMQDSTPVPDARRHGDDLAAVMYTGGTTGLPKGVMLSHSNLYASQLSTLMVSPRPVESVGINVAPMFHVGGAGVTLQFMMRLCKQVILPTFDELSFLRAVQDEQGTETFLVPLMLKRVVEHPRFAEFDSSSLKCVIYGAAPIDDVLLTQVLTQLPQTHFYQMYGMTELSPVITSLPDWCHQMAQPAQRRRSAGLPVPIAEVRIVDGDGRSLPHGQVGEITARGPMVMQGYWNKPGQTAEVLKDGWMFTGDGGYMDQDGFVYVVDRLKDMIVTGGENVYSAEVENAITQLPQVSMCAVVGIPDEQWGERVHAVVVLRATESLTAQAVIGHCKTVIANYKCPRSVEFRTEIPMSPAGKMLKYQLREPFWAGHTRRVN